MDKIKSDLVEKIIDILVDVIQVDNKGIISLDSLREASKKIINLIQGNSMEMITPRESKELLHRILTANEKIVLMNQKIADTLTNPVIIIQTRMQGDDNENQK